jgi:hypothetical protein
VAAVEAAERRSSYKGGKERKGKFLKGGNGGSRTLLPTY